MAETNPKRPQGGQSRTRDDLLVEAQRVRAEVARRLPPDKFEAHEGTELIDPEPMTAAFALRLVGVNFALVPADFPLGGDFEETVSVLVERTWEWRNRADNGDDGTHLNPGRTRGMTSAHPAEALLLSAFIDGDWCNPSKGAKNARPSCSGR